MKRTSYGMVMLAVLFGAAGHARSGYIYWTDLNQFQPGADIRRANLDGTRQTTIVSGFGGTIGAPNGIALDAAAGKMYWTVGILTNPGDPAGGAATIRRANLDGSAQEVVVPNRLFPVSIALDPSGGKMYWMQHSQLNYPLNLDIRRANLDGTAEETLVHNVVHVGNGSLALDLAGGKMYWTNYNGGDPGGTVSRANLDGSGQTTLVTGLNGPWGLALDLTAGQMYWADLGAGDIRRAELDGSGATTLVHGLNSPANIALDLQSGKMYWTDSTDTNGDIRRANLDGSGQQILVTGLHDPFAIALVPEPSVLLPLGIVGCGLMSRRHR